MPESFDEIAEENLDQVVTIQNRLKFYFAILSCLGGLVLASGEGAELIPVVAVFFAFFGFVFVDWLKLFALPPIAAYIMMGIAAVYCVSDFWDLDAPGNRQMLSVAQLLVSVQAILMLQEKTPRIFEQLAVFCLLELVVAAVFNDAPVYGMLLLPIGIIGALALALLASVSAGEGLQTAASESAPAHARLDTFQSFHQIVGCRHVADGKFCLVDACSRRPAGWCRLLLCIAQENGRRPHRGTWQRFGRL